MSTRRMRHVVTPVAAALPTWEPATVTTPRWERESAERWRGAAAAVTRGIPRTESRCLWRQERNRRLIAQYGRETLT